MIEYSDAEAQPQNEQKVNDVKKCDTRKKRKEITNNISKQLNQVLEAEEEYRDAIPYSFVNRIETAEETIELLVDTINSLTEAY